MAKKKLKTAFAIAALMLISAGALIWWSCGEQLQAWLTRVQFVVLMTIAPDLPAEGVEIPLQIIGSRIFIEQVQDNDAKLFLQVDTGCSASSFDPEVPLQVKASGATSYSIPGSMKNKHVSRIFYVSNFKFAGQKLPTLAVSSHSLDNTSCNIGRKVHGIIGQDILSSYSVELDYPRKLMVLKPLPRRERTDLQWDQGCPTVSLKIGNRQMIGIVDCGSDIVTVPEADASVLTAAKTMNYMLMDDIERVGKEGNAPITLAGKTFLGLPVGAGTYDNSLVGNAILQFFAVTMDSNNHHVDFKLHDWSGGDKLRKALGDERWAEAIQIIARPFPDDWREVRVLLNCYDKLGQFDKACELAKRQAERFPAEKTHWMIVQASCLHAAKKDNEAEALLSNFFSSRNGDPYTVVACVKALSDSQKDGAGVCDRLIPKYPQCDALKQIKAQLLAQVAKQK